MKQKKPKNTLKTEKHAQNRKSSKIKENNRFLE